MAPRATRQEPRESTLQAMVDFIESYRLLDGARRLLLAVSGGVDSMVLLDLMVRWTGTVPQVEIALCGHINHGLREEALQDERFVATEVPRRYHLPVVCRRIEVRRYAAARGLSLETAGREIRWHILERLAAEWRCDTVVTAHHGDDNVETLLHRLLRGTGWSGLAGIPPRRRLGPRCRVVRPLLGLTRSQIEQYAAARALPWREDRTNRDCRFTRNRLRHRLRPALQRQASGDLGSELRSLADRVRHWQERVEAEARASFDTLGIEPGRSVCLPARLVERQPPWTRLALIRIALQHAGLGLGAMSQQHYRALLNACDPSAPRKPWPLPGGFVATRTATGLCLGRPGSAPTADVGAGCLPLTIPGRVTLGSIHLTAAWARPEEVQFQGKPSHVEWLDADRVVGHLHLRRRRNGDRFIPFGHRRPQKVSRFLGRIQGPRDVWIVADDRAIVWVAPVRLAQPVALTDASRRILRLELIEKP